MNDLGHPAQTQPAARLRAFLREHSGISLGADKDYLVVSRLSPLLAAWRLPDLSALVVRLYEAPTGDIARGVVDALATHETMWFRDARPFETLRGPVMDALRQARDGMRRLSIWSAACSTGQEPWSIAMLLREEGIAAPAWDVSILASDLCGPTLARALEGRYGEFEMQRGLDPARLARHFARHGDDWRIDDALRRLVEFRELNLAQLPPGLGPFDVIFCRNVLIYFERELQAQVLEQLRERLAPGGFLFLGTAESPLGLVEGLAPGPWGHGIYRRAP